MSKRQCESAGVCTVTSCAAQVLHGDVQELPRALCEAAARVEPTDAVRRRGRAYV
jgi:hypothetical protein